MEGKKECNIFQHDYQRVLKNKREYSIIDILKTIRKGIFMAQKTEMYKAGAISYTLIRSSRKTLGMELGRDGRLILRAPHRLPQKAVEAFIAEKQAWIDQKRQRLAALPPMPEAKLEQNSTLELLGKAYRIAFKEQKAVSCTEDILSIPLRHADSPQNVLIPFFRELVRAKAGERGKYFAQRMCAQYNVLRITGALTRWGSCSSRGGVNFSWRLVFAPPELFDYVIVHELAHIKRQDHSAGFWRIVEEQLPDYKEKRKALRMLAQSREFLLFRECK